VGRDICQKQNVNGCQAAVTCSRAKFGTPSSRPFTIAKIISTPPHSHTHHFFEGINLFTAKTRNARSLFDWPKTVLTEKRGCVDLVGWLAPRPAQHLVPPLPRPFPVVALLHGTSNAANFGVTNGQSGTRIVSTVKECTTGTGNSFSIQKSVPRDNSVTTTVSRISHISASPKICHRVLA
jgi:hypothetical protein